MLQSQLTLFHLILIGTVDEIMYQHLCVLFLNEIVFHNDSPPEIKPHLCILPYANVGIALLGLNKVASGLSSVVNFCR